MKRNLILFGASIMGTIAYENLKENFNISYYTDNDKKKWGKQLYGIPIIEPDRLKLLQFEYDIIITSQYDVAITEQLIKMGIKRFGVYDADENNIRYYEYDYLDNFTRKKNKISLVVSNNSGSNTFALYKMIPKEISKKYDIVLVNENSKDNSYYLNLIESEMIVRTHDSFYNKEQKNVQLFHGFPLKGISNMSRYSKNNKEYNMNNWSKLDAIISYSQTYSTFLNACYGVDGQKYVITGAPRNDFLFKSKGKENLSRLYNIDFNNKNVIFYMPTFRETIYGEVDGNKNNFNILATGDFHIQEFDAFLNRLNCIMIIKMHPCHVGQFLNCSEYLKLRNIYFLKDEKLAKFSLDLYEVLNAADLLITDYSSVYFDFLLLDRPIIFTPLDLDEYEKNRGFLVEPYDFWAPGPKCFKFKELIQEISISLNDISYYKKEREIVCNIIHHYKDGNSSERVWNLIDELMTKR